MTAYNVCSLGICDAGRKPARTFVRYPGGRVLDTATSRRLDLPFLLEGEGHGERSSSRREAAALVSDCVGAPRPNVKSNRFLRNCAIHPLRPSAWDTPNCAIRCATGGSQCAKVCHRCASLAHRSYCQVNITAPATHSRGAPGERMNGEGFITDFRLNAGGQGERQRRSIIQPSLRLA